MKQKINIKSVIVKILFILMVFLIGIGFINITKKDVEKQENNNEKIEEEIDKKEYITLKEKILLDNEEKSDINIDFSFSPSGCKGWSYATKKCSTYDESQITNGLYYTDDNTLDLYGEDKEKVYYYRGQVDNNWVSFAGYLWRIIRTTSEDGIKLIYSNGTSEDSNIIKYSTFNSSENNKYYVGYTYNLKSYENVQMDSEIKKVIDDWYMGEKDFSSLTTKLSDYESYLSKTAIFCADRSEEIMKNENITFPAEERITVSKRPTFACPNSNGSRYTVDNAVGNGYLSHPIALLSADEVIYAGLDSSTENSDQESFITKNAYNWWTMSPSIFKNNAAVMLVNSNNIYAEHVYHTSDFVKAPGVRPSIVLKSCVSVTSGNGLFDSPYEITDENCN